MKSTIAAGAFFTLAVFGFFIFADTSAELRAAVIASVTINTESDACKDALKTSYPNTSHTEMHAVAYHLNSDAYNDYIIKLDSKSTCGSGGCIHEMCLSSDDGIRLIPFGYAAHTIEILETIESDMRTIEINGTTHMHWNGTEYILSDEY